MKTKLFLLLTATVLLLSVNVSAQSSKKTTPKKTESETPLKGDVNGDGKVDVADIVAILKIMKETGGTAGATTYYWYVGTTKPTSLDQCETLTSYPEEQTYTNNSGFKSHVFVLTNSDKTVEFIYPLIYDEVSQVDVDTKSIPGYKIWETAVGVANAGSIRIQVETIEPSTTYYWYVGTTKPTTLDQCSTVTSYPAEQIYTNNSGSKSHIFVLTNSDTTVKFRSISKVSQIDVDTKTIPGYKIWETAVGMANTGSIIIRIQ